MWPDSVERIAAFLRASATEGRLEEVLVDAEPPPGLELGVLAFDCEGRTVVALVPSGRRVDLRKLARAAGCDALRPVTSSLGFPFQGASVFVDQSALGAETVWLELDPPRHFLGLAPAQFLRLARSKTTDLLVETRSGEVDDRAQG